LKECFHTALKALLRPLSFVIFVCFRHKILLSMYTRVLLALIVLTVSLYSEQPNKKAAKAQQAPESDRRGTDQSPLVVKTLVPEKTQAETSQDANDRKEKAANDRHIVYLTGALAAFAFLQFLAYVYQGIKLRETVESASEQSKAMERHIGEANRSANAMEEIADVIQSGNKAILRAYLSVVIGLALFQERRDGTKFEGKPLLVNTGSTPARNVRIRISAEIVPYANAQNFAYPLAEELAKAPAVCAPHQNYTLSAIVENFIPDHEVADIKQGNGRALTVWGVVTYDDIFGEHHTTKFAQWLFWHPNGDVHGLFIPGQNDMD